MSSFNVSRNLKLIKHKSSSKKKSSSIKGNYTINTEFSAEEEETMKLNLQIKKQKMERFVSSIKQTVIDDNFLQLELKKETNANPMDKGDFILKTELQRNKDHKKQESLEVDILKQMEYNEFTGP